jgi:hypothetical protein
MKRAILFLALAFVTLNAAQAQRDWRNGIWHKDIPEHFLTLDLGGTYIITQNFKDMNPLGLNAQVGYQYKERPFQKRLSFAFGGYVGYSYYPSKDIVVEGSTFVLDSYKSYSYVPIMLNASLYFNIRTSYIFFGVDAGINLMLCERDYKADSVFTLPSQASPLVDTFVVMPLTFFPVANEGNPLTISRIVPTAKVYLGYMKEFNHNLRLRIKAGIEYNMGYEMDYQALMMNGSIVPATGKVKVVDNIDPFVTIGLVYSL